MDSMFQHRMEPGEKVMGVDKRHDDNRGWATFEFAANYIRLYNNEHASQNIPEITGPEEGRVESLEIHTLRSLWGHIHCGEGDSLYPY